MRKHLTKKTITSLFILILLLIPQLSLANWVEGLSNATSSDLPQNPIMDIIGALMKWLLGILGFICIIGFVISGIWYLTSYGDEERMKQAKNAMIYSIIGVIVGLMGLVIVVAVNEWLGGYSDF